MKTPILTREDKIRDFLKSLNTEIDILDYIDVDNVNSFEDIESQVDDNGGFNVEVIYYSNAIEYLKQNDPSLNESINLAIEMGCELKHVNSELLASLLKSQIDREEFSEKRKETVYFFEDLNS